MGDPRVAKLAHVLVNYSLEVQPGQVVQIVADAVTAPLVRELYRETLQAGAHPLLRLTLSGLDEIALTYSSDEQIRTVLDLDRQEIEAISGFIYVLGSENTKSLTRADARKVALRSQTNRPLNQRFFERVNQGQLSWVITQFPTPAAAQDAEMSLREYEDFVYGAGKLDLDDPAAAWAAVRAEQQRLADLLAARSEFRIVGPDTDLTYHTNRRSWINADGRRNFPDGEVFTSPDETRTDSLSRAYTQGARLPMCGWSSAPARWCRPAPPAAKIC